MTTETQRIYHTRIPGSTIQVMRGPGNCETIQFVGNKLVTSDPTVIAFCDEIANKPGSQIYTKAPVIDPTEGKGAAESLALARKAADAGLKSGEGK